MSHRQIKDSRVTFADKLNERTPKNEQTPHCYQMSQQPPRLLTWYVKSLAVAVPLGMIGCSAYFIRKEKLPHAYKTFGDNMGEMIFETFAGSALGCVLGVMYPMVLPLGIYCYVATEMQNTAPVCRCHKD